MKRIQERKQLLAEATRLYNDDRANEALAKFQECLYLFDEDDRSSIEFADCCGNYGSALAESGNLKLAERMFNSALSIYEAEAKQSDVARIYFNLGNVYGYMNNRQRCFDNYEKALKAYRACGDASGEGMCLLQMANHYAGLGALDLAREWLAEVDEVNNSAKNDPAFRWSWRFQQSKLALHDGQPERALELLEEALECAQKVGYPTYIEETEVAIAKIRLSLGHTGDALPKLERAYHASKARQDRYVLTNAYALAHALAAKGELESASPLYDECLALIDRKRGELDGAERFHWMGD